MLLVAACGSGGVGSEGVASLDDASPGALAADDAGGPVPASANGASVELTEEEALLAFAQCMREHGVDMDDPTVDADGNLQFGRSSSQESGQLSSEERAVFGAAREACATELESVALGFRDGDPTQLQDDLLAYAECMRDNGFEEMVDPDFSDSGPGGGGTGGGPFGEIDRTDPDFENAQEACGEILAGFGRGGGRSLGGGSAEADG